MRDSSTVGSPGITPARFIHEQPCRRVVDAVDPVGPTREREMAVGVDHARHDGGPSGVDELEAGAAPEVFLAVARSDPGVAAIFHEDADVVAEPPRAAVGERGVAVQHARGRGGRRR